MKVFLTEIMAISPKTGEIKKYGGPEIEALTMQDAQVFCENNGLGYCKVIGELVCEIGCKEGTHKPDFKNQIDYEDKYLN